MAFLKGLLKYGASSMGVSMPPPNPRTPPFLPSNTPYNAVGPSYDSESPAMPPPKMSTATMPPPEPPGPTQWEGGKFDNTIMPTFQLPPRSAAPLSPREQYAAMEPTPVPKPAGGWRGLAGGLMRTLPVFAQSGLADDVAYPGYRQQMQAHASREEQLKRQVEMQNATEAAEDRHLQRTAYRKNIESLDADRLRNDEQSKLKMREDVANNFRELGGVEVDPKVNPWEGVDESERNNYTFQQDQFGRTFKVPTEAERARDKKEGEQVNWRPLGEILDLYPDAFPALQAKGFKTPEQARQLEEMKQTKVPPAVYDKYLGMIQAGQTQKANAELRRDMAQYGRETSLMVAGIAASARNASAGVDEIPNNPGDPLSASILAQTGLSLNAFRALTGASGQLPRDSKIRNLAFKEAERFANSKGVDVSTLAAQYAAQNDVLKRNIARLNNTKIMEAELDGTLDNLASVVNKQDLARLRWANVVKIWANQEVNDPLAQQYAFHFGQLRNELAAYYAATQGRSGGDLTIQDKKEAEETIKRGISSGSIVGLRNGVKESTSKMTPIMERSVEAANKAIWNLFGVGGNYKSRGGSAPSQGGPAPGGYIVGHKYGGMTYQGGDPNKRESWK